GRRRWPRGVAAQSLTVRLRQRRLECGVVGGSARCLRRGPSGFSLDKQSPFVAGGVECAFVGIGEIGFHLAKRAFFLLCFFAPMLQGLDTAHFRALLQCLERSFGGSALAACAGELLLQRPLPDSGIIEQTFRGAKRTL